MRKNIAVLSIFIISVISLFACALPKEPVGVYYNDQQYDFTFKESNYNYRVNLDGTEEHIASFFISANIEETITDVRTQLNGDLIQIFDNDFGQNNYFCFLKNGNIAFFDGQSTSDTIKYELNKKYNLVFVSHVGKAISNNEYEFEFYKKEGDSKNIYCNIDKKVKMEETLLYTANYEIIDDKFIHITYELDEVPLGLFSYNEFKTQTEYGVIVWQDENEKGLIGVQADELLYIQLKDDNTFDFVYNLGNTEEEKIFNGTYQGKSFERIRIVYLDGVKYQYTSTITFDLIGNFKYEFSNILCRDEYRISEDGNLTKLGFDPEIYNKYIGTHYVINTSNNFSFANDYKVYVAYYGNNYVFKEDEIAIEDFGDYLHIYLYSSEKNYRCGFYYYIESGEIEWLSNEISI